MATVLAAHATTVPASTEVMRVMIALPRLIELKQPARIAQWAKYHKYLILLYLL
jgi:hypothetical protein